MARRKGTVRLQINCSIHDFLKFKEEAEEKGFKYPATLAKEKIFGKKNKKDGKDTQ